MTANQVLSTSVYGQLLQLDTCTVSNAIERLKGRMRNEGAVSGAALHSVFPELPPMLGYAATARMRSSSSPIVGEIFYDNMEWWRYVASLPEPRVIVVEDVDEKPGAGALFGELHTAIAMAVHAVGYVTNGSVRDLPALRRSGFPVFAGSVSVTHMYAHILEFGNPVEVGGLSISPGDLLHGDRHGVHRIPVNVAAEIPEMVAQIRQEERRIVDFCQSPSFSLDRLRALLEEVKGRRLEGNGCAPSQTDGRLGTVAAD